MCVCVCVCVCLCVFACLFVVVVLGVPFLLVLVFCLVFGQSYYSTHQEHPSVPASHKWRATLRPNCRSLSAGLCNSMNQHVSNALNPCSHVCKGLLQRCSPKLRQNRETGGAAEEGGRGGG